MKAALEGKFIQPTAVLYYNSSQNEAGKMWERFKKEKVNFGKTRIEREHLYSLRTKNF